MNHMKVLKRAWNILWSYRALWIFGILLALTTASSNGGGRGNVVFSGDEASRRSMFTPPAEVEAELNRLGDLLNQFFDRHFGGGDVPAALIALGIGLACAMLVLIVASVIVRYVSTTALIRMVDGYETTGERVTVKRGFRLGWSRRAWRLFLIKLVVAVPLVVVFILVAAVAVAPLLAWVSKNTAIGVLGTVAAIGLFFVAVCAMAIASVIAGLLISFAQRACALEDLGTIDSIRQGYRLVRGHLKDVGLMWLIMLGIGIAYAIAFIPAVLVFIVAGGVVGGALLLLVRGLVEIVANDAWPWIIGGIVGFPAFLAVLCVPLVLFGGLCEVFKSTVWTLTYRELTALEPVKIEAPVLPEEGVPTEENA